MQPNGCFIPTNRIEIEDGLCIQGRFEGIGHHVLGNEGMILLVPEIKEMVEIGKIETQTKATQKKQENGEFLLVGKLKQQGTRQIEGNGEINEGIRKVKSGHQVKCGLVLLAKILKSV